MYDLTPQHAPPQTALRFALLPVVVAGAGIAFGAATGGIAWLAAPVALAAAGGGGFWIWRTHKKQLGEHQAKRIETLALSTFRSHQGPTMTKEQLVRDHRLHPDDADIVLNCLVEHDLLTADWDNYDGPLVYQRSDAAAGLPIPTPAPPSPPPRPPARAPVPAPGGHQMPPPRIGVVPPYRNPGLASFLSLILPGAGQIYAGRVRRGIAWMFGTAVGYLLGGVPGFILHLVGIFDARTQAHETNRYIQRFGTLPGPDSHARLRPPHRHHHPGRHPGRHPGPPPYRPPRS